MNDSPTDAAERLPLSLTVTSGRFDPRSVAALRDWLEPHFELTVRQEALLGRDATDVSIAVSQPAVARLGLPTVANLLSRPLYRALVAELLGTRRDPPLRVRLQFTDAGRGTTFTVLTNDPDVLKHALDTVLEQLARGEALLEYDERSGAWRA